MCGMREHLTSDRISTRESVTNCDTSACEFITNCNTSTKHISRSKTRLL